MVDRPARAIPMAITMGDASGVGPEIVLRRAAAGQLDDDLVVYGDAAVLRAGAQMLDLDVDVQVVDDPSQRRAGALNVVDAGLLDAHDLMPGQLSAAAGAAARAYVLAATHDALAGRVAGLVTMPMNKEATQLTDPTFVGHTELIAATCGVSRYSMMLAAGDLAVTHVSTHVSLQEAIRRVTVERVGEVISLTNETLRAFVPAPRIAVCGLNPHAGEHGLFGDEDARDIAPAIAAAQAARHRRQRAASGRHGVPPGRAPSPVRRDRVHVPRPGPHADEAAGVRERCQRDDRPADRAHLGGSRHRVRHRLAGSRVHRIARARAAMGSPPGRSRRLSAPWVRAESGDAPIRCCCGRGVARRFLHGWFRVERSVCREELSRRCRLDTTGQRTGDVDIRVPTATAPSAEIPPTATGEIDVDSTDELRAAIEAAQPGDVIVVAEGEYRFDDRLVAEPSGDRGVTDHTARIACVIIRTKNASGDYGLHLTGDHWRIEGLTVAHATKGIVLDGSVGTVIDGVEVYDIGDEGVHFRSCSSDGVLATRSCTTPVATAPSTARACTSVRPTPTGPSTSAPTRSKA